MGQSDYTLVAFDAEGQEQRDQNGDLGSDKAVAQLTKQPVTDVFIMSHGWMGDLPAAIWQYNHWTDALMACDGDIATMKKLRPGFKPLMIGFHWPSLPWGNETAVAAFAIDGASPAFDPVAKAAATFGSAPEITSAVSKIFAAVGNAPDPDRLSPDLRQAYLDLDQLLRFGAEGPASTPAADRLPFDPDRVLNATRSTAGAVSFGGFDLGDLLAPLRTLSFWSMKDRARTLGETAGCGLLCKLQAAAEGRDVHFHLMGHSFGSIVVSSMLAGTPGGPAPKPVQSAVLAQGALSLWSYAEEVPKSPGTPGYFHGVLKEGRVAGPIVTTQSSFDLAVGRWYPIAAGVALQASFEAATEFPLFGGVGTFGLQGISKSVPLESMLPTKDDYRFQAGHVYNIQSDNVIKDQGDPNSGAHSDINHPEVGHVIWQAAMTPVN